MIARWGPADCDPQQLVGPGPVPEDRRAELRPTLQRAAVRCLETGVMLRDWSLVREGTRHLADALEPVWGQNTRETSPDRPGSQN